MADRFNRTAFSNAFTGSGVTSTSNVVAEMQESDGSPFNGDETFLQSSNAFNTSGSILPSDNTTLGTKTAQGGTEFDKLQWKVDFGSGQIRFFRIDNIGETGIETGEDVTVNTGSLECGTTGLANIVRDGLSNVSIDVDVVDGGGTTQASFAGVAYSFSDSNDTFSNDNTLSFKNNTGSSFTLDQIKVYADSDFWFSVSRSDSVPDGAEVDISQLDLEITNLS